MSVGRRLPASSQALSQFCITRARNFIFSVLSKSQSPRPKFLGTAPLKKLPAENQPPHRTCRTSRADGIGLDDRTEEARPFEPFWELGNEVS
jgi:hypothetical protein